MIIQGIIELGYNIHSACFWILEYQLNCSAILSEALTVGRIIFKDIKFRGYSTFHFK